MSFVHRYIGKKLELSRTRHRENARRKFTDKRFNDSVGKDFHAKILYHAAALHDITSSDNYSFMYTY